MQIVYAPSHVTPNILDAAVGERAGFGSLIRALALLLLSSFLWLPPAHALTILVRYDDYSSRSDTALERRLLAEIEALGGGVLVSVIPYPGAPYPEGDPLPLRPLNLGSDKISLLDHYVRRGAAEIAVHGYSHVDNGRLGQSTEFGVLPESDQRRLLAAARAAMQQSFGRDIVAYVPPFNDHSERTISALEQVGFKLLSAGTPATGQRCGVMKCMPATVYPRKLRAVVEEALRKGHRDVLITVVIHAYDFVESTQSLPSFRTNSNQISLTEFISDLKSMAAIDGVEIVSPALLLGQGEDLSDQRMQANLGIWSAAVVREHLLPESWKLYPVAGAYYSLAAANELRFRQLLVVAALWTSLLAVVAFLTALGLSCANRRAKSIAWTLLIVSLVGIVGALARVVTGNFYLKVEAALAGCIGVLLGASFQLRHEGRNMVNCIRAKLSHRRARRRTSRPFCATPGLGSRPVPLDVRTDRQVD